MGCSKFSPQCESFDVCCLEKLNETIKYTLKLFNDLNIEYWIDYNLLKGALDQTVYSHRNAIGFDVKEFDKILSLSHRIYEDGYFLNCEKVGTDYWVKIYYSKMNHLSLDLIDWNINRGYVTRKQSIYANSGGNFHQRYINPLERITVCDIIAKCPNNPNMFIKAR